MPCYVQPVHICRLVRVSAVCQAVTELELSKIDKHMQLHSQVISGLKSLDYVTANANLCIFSHVLLVVIKCKTLIIKDKTFTIYIEEYLHF